MPVISDSHFAACMSAFDIPAHQHLAVAVSGGADSLCLTFLLNKWAKSKGHTLTALTVDHGLRAESKQEAMQVANQMKLFHIEHVILTWTGKKPVTRVEEQARNARYKLLTNWCCEQGITYLFLAHHAADQAETFWARLSKGSGITGLSAMAPLSNRHSIKLVRPLLNMSKQDIIDTLQVHGMTWAEDPMNTDPAYERVRWRQNLPILDKMGLSIKAVCQSAARLNRAEQAIDFYTHQFLDQHVQVDNRGFAVIDTQHFMKIPVEIQMRVLGYLITLIGQSSKIIALETLEKTVQRMPFKMTLGDCHIIPHKKGIFIAKEHARQPPPAKIPAKQWTWWDRFWIWCDVAAFVHAGAPHKREKDIPFLVQQSFAQIKYTQKTLEINTKLDYKYKTPYIESHIHFTPKNKG